MLTPSSIVLSHIYDPIISDHAIHGQMLHLKWSVSYFYPNGVTQYIKRYIRHFLKRPFMRFQGQVLTIYPPFFVEKQRQFCFQKYFFQNQGHFSKFTPICAKQGHHSKDNIFKPDLLNTKILIFIPSIYSTDNFRFFCFCFVLCFFWGGGFFFCFLFFVFFCFVFVCVFFFVCFCFCFLSLFRFLSFSTFKFYWPTFLQSQKSQSNED